MIIKLGSYEIIRLILIFFFNFFLIYHFLIKIKTVEVTTSGIGITKMLSENAIKNAIETSKCTAVA